MKRLRIKIHHLRSGEKYYTEVLEADEKQEEEIARLVTMAASGDLNYLTNRNEESNLYKRSGTKEFWYLPAKVLSESAIYLEEVR